MIITTPEAQKDIAQGQGTSSDNAMDLPSHDHSDTLICASQSSPKPANADGTTTYSTHFIRCAPFLPPEVIGMVVKELKDQMNDEKEWRRQLCVIARTSRQLQVEAERNLYRDIVFRVGGPHAAAIATILQARVAKYVCGLEIVNYGRSSPCEIPNRTVTAIPFTLKVYYTDDSGENDDFAADPVDPTLFHLLEKDLPSDVLTSFDSPLPLYPSRLSFLDRQSCIIELTFNPIVADMRSTQCLVSKHRFCKLKLLAVERMGPAISSFVAGAHLIHFAAFDTMIFLKEWPSFAPNLISLSVINFPMTPAILQEVTECSPQLRILFFSADPEWETQEDTSIFDALEHLKQLVMVAVVFMWSPEFIVSTLEKCPPPTMIDPLLLTVQGDYRVEVSREGGEWKTCALSEERLSRWSEERAAAYDLQETDDGEKFGEFKINW